MRIRSFWLLTACLAAALCGGVQALALPGQAELTWEEVASFKHSHDYFALRDRLAAAGHKNTLVARYARALLQHAFNQPAASNATITRLLSHDGIPESRASDLRQLAMENDLRLGRYRDGLTMADALLAHPAGLEPSEMKDAQNTRRIFQALVDVPAESVKIDGATTLQLDAGSIPLEVNGSPRKFVFDTGANLSTIMRSEAQSLGMRIRTAGIDVGTSTDRRILADLAVADRVEIGRMHFSNVVFLVLDDKLLTIGDQVRIPGIVGFPVIERMGEVDISPKGEIRIPATAPRRKDQNMALDGLTLLTRARWGDDSLLCRIDTGANTTQLYEPLYRRLRERIDGISKPEVRKLGGAGGVRELAVRVIPDLRLEIGNAHGPALPTDVLVKSIAQSEDDNYLDANIGHDILDAFPHCILNFRYMAFILQ